MWRRCVRGDARHHAGSGARCGGTGASASAESLKRVVAYVP